jgi:hypothetical protein
LVGFPSVGDRSHQGRSRTCPPEGDGPGGQR